VKFVYLIIFLFAFFLGTPSYVNAQQCTGFRLCADCTKTCGCHIPGDPRIGSCSNEGTNNCGPDSRGDCICEETCEGFFTKSCEVLINENSCNGGGSCYPSDDVSHTCEWGSGGYCGDGSCNNGETNATCPADCPAGGGNNNCGNGTCDNGENSGSCPADCSTPPGWGSCGQCGVSGGAPGSPNWRDGNCAASLLVQNNGDQSAANSQNGGALPYCICDPGSCAPPPCTPSCANNCGQSNGCSGYCPDTDDATLDGIPIVFQSPTGGRATISNGLVSIGWTAIPKADYYRIRIRRQGDNCAAPGSICSTTANTNYTFAPDPAGGNAYQVQVMPVNNTCQVRNGDWTVMNFVIYSTITGFVVQDAENDAGLSGSYCQDANSGTLISPGTGGSIAANNGAYTATFGGTGTYSISLPWLPVQSGSSNSVRLTPGTDGSGDQYACSCPSGCIYTGVPSPKTTVNFYLNSLDLSNESWWQVQGGNVMAARTGGRALETYVPYDTCNADPSCSPAMIARDESNLEASAGVAVTGGGVIDTSSANGVNYDYVSDRTTQIYAEGSTLGSLTENYEYFKRLYSIGESPQDDFAGSAGNAAKPTAAPLNGRAYYTSGNLTIDQPWNVGANESIVVFVDEANGVPGILHISDSSNAEQLITVAPGGFLAFIVSGDIRFDENLGNDDPDDATPNVEGVFFSDGQIVVQSNGGATPDDDRFVGAGTFVGWGGFALGRSYADGGTGMANNNTRPIELFIYRPDFVQNVPEQMARPYYIWQETQ
jgi:hypothetical protein